MSFLSHSLHADQDEWVRKRLHAIQAAHLIEWMGGQYAAENPLFIQAHRELRELGYSQADIERGLIIERDRHA